MFHSASLIHIPRIDHGGPRVSARLSSAKGLEILDEADEGCVDLVRALLLSPVTAAR